MSLLWLKDILVGSQEKPFDYALSLFQDHIGMMLIILPVTLYFLWLIFIGLVTGSKYGRTISKPNYILAMLGILFVGLVIAGYLFLLNLIQNGGLN